jgi:hypothetical protein
LARGSEAIATALDVYGETRDTWGGLCNVLDAIRGDLDGGEEAVWREGYMTEAQWKLLQKTASNYRALGPKARHAKLAYPLPKDQMRLDEAQRIVAAALEKWIRSKPAPDD